MDVTQGTVSLRVASADVHRRCCCGWAYVFRRCCSGVVHCSALVVMVEVYTEALCAAHSASGRTTFNCDGMHTGTRMEAYLQCDCGFTLLTRLSVVNVST